MKIKRSLLRISTILLIYSLACVLPFETYILILFSCYFLRLKIQKILKKMENSEIFLFSGVLPLFCRTINNIWQQGSKSTALCWTGCPTPDQLLYRGVKMLDFSLIWFSANHFIKPCQKQDVSLHDQNKWKRDSFSVLQKVQISFSVMSISLRKIGRASCRERV